MAWRAIIDRLDGMTRVEVSEIRFGALPSVGTEITSEINGDAVKAVVGGVATFPCKSPGTAVDVVNHVFAKEVETKPN